MKEKYIGLIVLTISVLFSLIIAEIGVRYIIPFKAYTDERNLTYRHDKDLGWFPKKNTVKTYEGSRKINVRHNNYRFRDIDYSFDDKEDNVVFLGDSFVWGYDVEQDERFTNILRDEKQLGSSKIYNFGVSGYGTDQSFLLLKKHYDKLKPKTVFLAFCGNDFGDNSANMRYFGYFKPYFETLESGEIELRGTPAPLSRNYKMLDIEANYPILSKSRLFNATMSLVWKYEYKLNKVKVVDPTYKILSSMNKMMLDNGTRFIVGIIDKYQKEELEEFLTKNNIEFIDIYSDHRYKSHGGHWTVEGNKFVANKVLSKIKN